MNLEEQRKIFSGACAANDKEDFNEQCNKKYKKAYLLLAKRYPGKIHICPFCANSWWYDRDETYQKYETPLNEEEWAYWHNHARKRCCNCNHAISAYRLISYRKLLEIEIKKYFDETEEHEQDFDELIEYIKKSPSLFVVASSLLDGATRGEFGENRRY